MEPPAKTMNEVLERLRDGTRPDVQKWRDLADALRMLVILGKDSDARDLNRDLSDYTE